MYAQREIAYVQDTIKDRSKIFWEIIFFRAITMTVSIIIFFCTFVNGNNDYKTYYLIFSLELISNCFDITWFFQGLEDFKKTVTRNIIVKLISILLIFMLVKTSNDLNMYILIYVISNLIGNLSLWFYLPKNIQKIKMKDLNIIRHLKPTIWLFIPQISMQIYTVMDKTMLGIIIQNKAEVGYYEQAQKIVKLCLTIVTSLGTVMVPRMANTFIKGEKDKMNEYMLKSFKFVYFISIPTFIGVNLIAKQFVPIFFGDGYEKVSALINVISPIIIIIGLSNIIGMQYLLPAKKQKEFTISVTVGAIINFMLNIFCIRRSGAIGASIATVIAELTITIIQLYFIKEDFKILEFIKIAKNNSIAGVGMIIPVILVKIIPMNEYFSILLQIVIGVVIYFIILMLLKDEFVNVINEKIIKRGFNYYDRKDKKC